MTSSESETEDLPCSMQIDDSLEERLKSHGVSRRNVRTIIHTIFSDENVWKLLDGTIDGAEDAMLDIPEAPVTRSNYLSNNVEEADDFDLSDLIPCQSANNDENATATPYLIEETNTESVSRDHFNESSGNDQHTDANDAYFDRNGNFDWMAWLNMPDETQNATDVERNHDSDDDPDYNFLADPGLKDEEDFRYDRTTRITKKELRSLKKGKKLSLHSVGKSMAIPKPHKGANGNKRPFHSELSEDVVEEFLKCSTAREKINLLRKNPNLPVRPKRLKRDIDINCFRFSAYQYDTLLQQMQQHIQLLTQCHLMESPVNPSNSCTLLKEIRFLSSLSTQPSSSAFNAFNLHEAIQITEIDQRELFRGFDGQSLGHHLNVPSIIANSLVFMYKELLPDFPIKDKSIKKCKFSYHEDCLIAHGYYEMSGHYMTPSDLTQQLLLPCHTREEVYARVKVVMQRKVKNFINNPIFKLRKFGKLPSPNNTVKFVRSSDAIKPIEMDGALPSWLKSFQALSSQMLDDSVVKPSAQNLKISSSGIVSVFWTKEMDLKMLSVIKSQGCVNKKVLNLLHSLFPMRTRKQIKNRLLKLMELYDKP